MLRHTRERETERQRQTSNFVSFNLLAANLCERVYLGAIWGMKASKRVVPDRCCDFRPIILGNSSQTSRIDVFVCREKVIEVQRRNWERENEYVYISSCELCVIIIVKCYRAARYYCTMKVRCYKLEMHGMAGLHWVCERFGVLPNREGEADALCTQAG